MKHHLIFMLAIAILLLAGCAGNPQQSASNVDLDLTTLSSTMVYSEVYNMVSTPASYENKTIRLSGTFVSSASEDGSTIYYFVVIADATACCQQGLEVVLPEEFSTPAEGASILLEGRYLPYIEGDVLYYHILAEYAELL